MTLKFDKLKIEREMITFSPFLVEIDNFVNYFDALTTTALRFTDDFRVVTLFFSEDIDVQHFFRVAPPFSEDENSE